MSNLTLGSLFDGSGGFPLAGMMAGITPVWASEIEPFPIRVTTKRIPQMKHYGDISKMNGAEIEPVDIITFGSPCQNLSLAGKREGLTGEKSSMFFEAIRVIKEMRCATNGKYPRWIVWENVPGALSSSKGQDFRTVLEEICKIKDETVSVPMPEKKWTGAGEIMGNGYSVAYRILDAQFWGVPQRRRRVFLVADFTGECAGKVLFESEGVFGNFKKSLCSRQGTAGAVKTSVGEAGGTICLNDQGGERMDVTEDKTTTLRARANHPPCVIESAGFCTEHSSKSRSIGYNTEQSPTLRAGVTPAALMFENHSQDTRYIGPLKVAQTVLATFGTGGNNQPFVVHTPKTLKIRGGCEGGGKGALVQENKSATLGCNNDQTLFEPKAYGICSKESNSMKSDNPNSGIYEADTSRTIDGNGGNPSCNQGGMAIVCIDQGGGKSNCGISMDKSPTLSCTHGGEPTVCIQGSMIGRKDTNGPNGSGINQDTSFTLNTVDRHAVAYGIERAAFNQGKNALYNFSIVFANTFGAETAEKLLGGHYAYCPYGVKHFKDIGIWKINNPQKGDVIMFKNASGVACHTGIVIAVDSKRVYTIEGNTSSASGVVANGGCVAKKSYSISYSRIMGYGDVNYNSIEEDELMSKEYEELKAEITALKTEVAKLNSKMIYNYVDKNMPEWARPTIQKMMDKGLLQGDENGCLGLTDELLRVFVTNDRAGVYDHRWDGKSS